MSEQVVQKDPNLGKKTRGRRGPNRLTREVRQHLQDAFDGLGGLEGFIEWGKENPTEFYKLWIKLLPQEIRSKLSAPAALIDFIQEGRQRTKLLDITPVAEDIVTKGKKANSRAAK